MKAKELIAHLQTVDPDAEIAVVVDRDEGGLPDFGPLSTVKRNYTIRISAGPVVQMVVLEAKPNWGANTEIAEL